MEHSVTLSWLKELRHSTAIVHGGTAERCPYGAANTTGVVFRADRTRARGAEASALKIGQRMHVVFDPAVDGITLPQFEIAA